LNCLCLRNARRISALRAILFLMLLVVLLIPYTGHTESSDEYYQLISDDCYLLVNEYTGYEELIPLHTVTSVGRENVKVNGKISQNELLEYTIPDELLLEDPYFAALMMEADKYIGYPFVLNASNPNEGFDCSGFVSWVYIYSGVYNTGRRGATGLYSLCTEVDPEEACPGDLVFFKGTMGAEVKGITHVGIYVGNNMMIHAGDPVGFADLTDPKWEKHLLCYGRLPFKEEYESE